MGSTEPKPRRISLYTWGRVGVALCVALLTFAAAFVTLERRPPRPRVVVAYERVPQAFDGAERYLLDVLRALGGVVDVTFIARSTTGSCAPSAADLAALKDALPDHAHVLVHGEDAPVGSTAFDRGLRNAAALLLPVSLLENTCGGGSSELASAELYSAAAQRGAPSPRPRVVVFSFDAHAARARSLSRAEVDAGQARRYAAAADALVGREAALYSSADALVVLTPEDAADTPPAREPTVIVPFRVPLPPGSAAAAEAAGTPAAAAVPGWAGRSGFLFVGSGDNPTNALALQAFLLHVWPTVRARLPSAELHVVGRPPARLCAAHGVWCDGWLSGTPLAADGGGGAAGAGVRLYGLVADVTPLLRSSRVGVAPMICGTGVNTKVALMLAEGLPVVGTAKAARGYAPRAVPGARPGVEVADMPGVEGAAVVVGGASQQQRRGMADALIALHEDPVEWAAAHAAALGHAAELGAAAAGGAGAADIARLLRACGVSAPPAGPARTARG